jgi:hypothetical protein
VSDRVDVVDRRVEIVEDIAHCFDCKETDV